MSTARNASIAQTRRQKREVQRRRSRLQSLGLILAGVVIVAVVLLGLAKSDANLGVHPAVTGQALGDLALSDLSGKTVHLKDYAGKPVLINAWATWCPPCRAEMPDLFAYYQAHEAEGFNMLAINAGEDHDTVKSFITQAGFTFPVLLDPGTQVLNRLGINSFPTSVLVGRDGLVKTIHIGMFTPQSLAAEITPLLGKQ